MAKMKLTDYSRMVGTRSIASKQRVFAKGILQRIQFEPEYF